jgi:hypothetical protein
MKNYRKFLEKLQAELIDMELKVHNQIIQNKILGEGTFLKCIKDDLDTIKIAVRAKLNKVGK